MQKIEGYKICNASEVCTKFGCKGSIIAKNVGALGTQLIVDCPDRPNAEMATSDLIEDAEAVELKDGYKAGDHEASLFVHWYAPVCNDNGPDYLSNPNILINGKPTDIYLESSDQLTYTVGELF